MYLRDTSTFFFNKMLNTTLGLFAYPHKFQFLCINYIYHKPFKINILRASILRLGFVPLLTDAKVVFVKVLKKRQ